MGAAVVVRSGIVGLGWVNNALVSPDADRGGFFYTQVTTPARDLLTAYARAEIGPREISSVNIP